MFYRLSPRFPFRAEEPPSFALDETGLLWEQRDCEMALCGQYRRGWDCIDHRPAVLDQIELDIVHFPLRPAVCGGPDLMFMQSSRFRKLSKAHCYWLTSHAVDFELVPMKVDARDV